MAQSWYNAIQAGTAAQGLRVKEDLRAMQPGMEVKHVGWITEQVPPRPSGPRGDKRTFTLLAWTDLCTVCVCTVCVCTVYV